MELQIDHVTIAGSDLKTLERAFTNLDLKPEYGGPHSNGITHMALLGFDDGSYVELISTLEPGQRAPTWGEAISGSAGPCAWAVGASDIQGDAARITGAGIPVRGPNAMNRQRPDGVLVEWDLAYLGSLQPGALLPFIIQDRTPREWRVKPTPGLAEKGLIGVESVILGAQDLGAAASLFQRAFGWPDPLIQDDPGFGARLAHFPNTPVILATPLDQNWLTTRLVRFGEMPCAFLIRTPDLEAVSNRFGLTKGTNWFQRRIAWFDPQKLLGARLGCAQ
jgi:hypothetical protein